MSRFFFSNVQRHGDRILLNNDDAHHLRSVLRCSVGDEIELCDEKGRSFCAEIVAIGRDCAACVLKEELPCREAAVRFTLAFALLKGEKNELLLRSGTELGLAGFLPFDSERTVLRPESIKLHRANRWQRIVRAAAGQARRDLLPEIAPLHTWDEFLAVIPCYKKTILFYEGNGCLPLSAALHGVFPGDRVLLVTGPEGGFTAAEVAAVSALGGLIVTLGPRILRAETSAVAAAALALYQAGELGGQV
jgi:16S rRNA (uracil1498-N3)-methyltransferase